MIRLMLTRNMVFNIINEKTIASLIKVLSNMYNKPYALNRVYLIWICRLFKLKMAEGKFNVILTRLSSVN